MQQQSDRELAESKENLIEQQLDIDNLELLQEDASWFSKFLCLHHVRAVFRYLTQGINNKNIFRYDKDYDKYIPTTRLRDLAMKRHQYGEQFSGFLTLLSTESGPILIIILLSMVVAAATTVVIYYQQTLVQKIINQTTNQQYKFFGIIVGFVVFRFIIYNFLISLASNVALNVRVSIQNYYMRIIFMVDNQQFATNLYRFRFLDIQSIVEAVILMPYMLISFCTIVGLIVLVFILNGKYGFIVLGIFLLSFFIITLLMIVIYRELQQRQETKTEFAKKAKYVFQSLISILFENLTSRLLNNLVGRKEKLLNQDRFVNRGYILSQFAADSAVIVPIIIYYGLYSNGISTLTLQNTYLTAVYLGMIYFPFKLLVYGAFFMVKGVQNYQSILKDFQSINKRRLKDLNANVYSQNHHSFFDDIGGCFKYDYQLFHMTRFVSKKSLVQEMNRVSSGLPAIAPERTSTYHFDALPLEERQKFITLCSFMECEGRLENYIEKLKVEIPKANTLAIIDEDPFLMPESFKENIILYSQFDQVAKKKFQHALNLVGLGYLTAQIYKQQNNKINGNLARYYSWHEARLQLARALFHNVDYLIIHKYTLTRDTLLMKRIIEQRKRNDKVTIIVNRNNFQLLSLPGKVMLFTPKGIDVSSTEEVLKAKSYFWNLILNKLCSKALKEQIVKEILKQEFVDLGPIKPIEYEINSQAYKNFFSLVHTGSILVVLLVLAGPPCFKFYMSYLVGQSLKYGIYPNYLIFAAIYLCFVLIKGFILTGYLRAGSRELFIKTAATLERLSAHEIISYYKKRDISIQGDFRKIDSQFFMNFQIGVTSVLEGFIAIIIVSVGQPIYVAIALPVTIMSLVINSLYTKIYKKLQQMKEKNLLMIRYYVNACTTYSMQLLRYNKYEVVQKRFHNFNRTSVLFAANQIWILSGMRIIGELIFIIGLVIFLVIMIETQANKVSNLSMVSLGVSLFISLNFSYRFSIKTFSVIQSQLLALSKIQQNIQEAVKEQSQKSSKAISAHEKLNEQPQGFQLVVRNDWQTIHYINVIIDIGQFGSQAINLAIRKGDRIGVSYDSRVLADLVFLSLNPNICGRPRRIGQILINNSTPIEEENLKVIYLQDYPLLPIQGTIFQASSFLEQSLEKDQLAVGIQNFFKDLDISPLFNADTLIENMPLPYKQILSVFKVTSFQKCDILVLAGGLDDVSILVRQKVQSYLIKSKISIVISVANLLSIIDLYPRHLRVENKNVTEIKPLKLQSKLTFQNQSKNP